MALNAETTEGINSWDFNTQHVQDQLQGHDFISAKSILIAAGPPRKGDIGKDWNSLYPIGVVDNVGIGQNKGLQQIFEVGSSRPYFLPGRTVNSLQLGRVLFYGPSLLRVMYAYYPQSKMSNYAEEIYSGGSEKVPFEGEEGRTPNIKDAPGAAVGNGAYVGDQNKDFFINLASDLFDHPLGLMMWVSATSGLPYGAMYLEEVYIQAHQFNVNSNSVIIAEGANCQFVKINPCKMGKTTPIPTGTI